MIGLIVPSNADVFGASQASGAAASPFVHGQTCLTKYAHFFTDLRPAANTLQARGPANVVNAALLVFVISAANSDLYITSRALYSLALLGHAPRIFRKVTRRGVPVWAPLMCWLFSMLVFLNVAEGSQTVRHPEHSPHLGLNPLAGQYFPTLLESGRHVWRNHLE